MSHNDFFSWSAVFLARVGSQEVSAASGTRSEDNKDDRLGVSFKVADIMGAKENFQVDMRWSRVGGGVNNTHLKKSEREGGGGVKRVRKRVDAAGDRGASGDDKPHQMRSVPIGGPPPPNGDGRLQWRGSLSGSDMAFGESSRNRIEREKEERDRAVAVAATAKICGGGGGGSSSSGHYSSVGRQDGRASSGPELSSRSVVDFFRTHLWVRL